MGGQGKVIGSLILTVSCLDLVSVFFGLTAYIRYVRKNKKNKEEEDKNKGSENEGENRKTQNRPNTTGYDENVKLYRSNK